MRASIAVSLLFGALGTLSGCSSNSPVPIRELRPTVVKPTIESPIQNASHKDDYSMQELTRLVAEASIENDDYQGITKHEDENIGDDRTRYTISLTHQNVNYDICIIQRKDRNVYMSIFIDGLEYKENCNDDDSQRGKATFTDLGLDGVVDNFLCGGIYYSRATGIGIKHKFFLNEWYSKTLTSLAKFYGIETKSNK